MAKCVNTRCQKREASISQIYVYTHIGLRKTYQTVFLKIGLEVTFFCFGALLKENIET